MTHYTREQGVVSRAKETTWKVKYETLSEPDAAPCIDCAGLGGDSRPAIDGNPIEQVAAGRPEMVPERVPSQPLELQQPRNRSQSGQRFRPDLAMGRRGWSFGSYLASFGRRDRIRRGGRDDLRISGQRWHLSLVAPLMLGAGHGRSGVESAGALGGRWGRRLGRLRPGDRQPDLVS